MGASPMNSSAATSAYSVRFPSPSAQKVMNLTPPSPRITMNDSSNAWTRKLETRLESLIQLREGWDGYHAAPVSLTNAVFALKMLERLYSASLPPPDLVPGYGGDLQAEWHVSGIDIELHVRGANDVLAWRATPETGEDGEEVALTNDFTVVGEWIKQLANSANAVASAAA